jgi:hypothetical protein
MRLWCLLIILGVGRCFSPGSVLFAADEPTGGIQGTILFKGEIPKPEVLVDGKKNPMCGPQGVLSESLVVNPRTMGLKNVFVYMVKRPDGYELPEAKPADQNVVLDQINCRFEPHALIVRTNQTLLAKSQDGFVHNLRTASVRNMGVNLLVHAEDRDGVPIQFNVSEKVPVPAKCDIHSWMESRILIVDHPFAAVTGDAGEFQIADLPVGQHEFNIWHEKVGYLHRNLKIEVKADEATTLETIEVPAEKFK